MRKSGGGHGNGMLVLFLITGAVLGGILGELIAGWDLMGIGPYLIKAFPIFDLPPVTINLFVVKFIVGFSLHPSLISIAGVILAFWLFKRV
ncbi:MAG: hypothetical protein H6Q73_846 [Firmicutes bacterium]|nr:hypothetical protein [Bacillota bacterium]